jgi:hypothetical protein
MDNGLPIEVTTEDAVLLADIAKAQYRLPEQQAAAFVHAALEAHRAKASAPDKPASAGTKRGPKALAA